MYRQNLLRDLLLFLRASATNQIARFTPKLYMQMIRETGRGHNETCPLETAQYFFKCYEDYRSQMELSEQKFISFLKGKHILEYGPGDILGVALLLYAKGAERVTCVDKFPLVTMSEKNMAVYRHLIDMLDGAAQKRANKTFNVHGLPQSGFNHCAVNYRVTKNGLSGSISEYDMILSRAVLEHVDDLSLTMKDINSSLKDGGMSINEVDLRSHGLDRYTEFDFLTWPRIIYKMMFCHKGVPNRLRINEYIKLANKNGLSIEKLCPTGYLEKEKIELICYKVAKEFRNIPIENLSWTGFWMHIVKT